MITRYTLMAFAVVLGTGGAFAIVHAQVGQGSPIAVSYDEETVVDPDAQALYQSMRNILNGYDGVPNDRLVYYSAVNDANDCSISGWQGIITNVVPNGNGHLVTLYVAPNLISGTYGPTPVILNSDNEEQYQVYNNGTFDYVGSLDPNGLAGQLPSMAGL